MSLADHLLRLIAAPWKLIYYEAYLERGDALGRERYLKSGSGRKFLKVQVRHYLDKNHSPREHCFYAEEPARSTTEENAERSPADVEG